MREEKGNFSLFIFYFNFDIKNEKYKLKHKARQTEMKWGNYEQNTKRVSKENHLKFDSIAYKRNGWSGVAWLLLLQFLSDIEEVNRKCFSLGKISRNNFFFPLPCAALNADNDRVADDIRYWIGCSDYGQLAHFNRAYTLDYYSP